MRALVEGKQVLKVFSRPQSVTINGITYPSQIFSQWADDDLNAIGLYKFVEVFPDQRFYSHSAYVDDIDQNVVTRRYTPVPRDLEDVMTDEVDEKGDVVIRKGLKSKAIQSIKQEAGQRLKPTDWKLLRQIENPNKPVDAATLSYRAAIRTRSDEIEAAIEACTTIESFAELYNKSENGIAPINDWPADIG